MVRTPQKAELLTVDEIAAIKKQLTDAIELCEEAEKVAKDKGTQGFYVIYKSAILRTVESLRRTQTSIYQTVNATRLGKPMTAESTSPMAKRIAKARAQVTEVKKQLRKKGHSGE